MPIFSAGDFDPKVGQTDLAFGVRSGLTITSRSVRVQDYKSLCAAVTIYATMVNIHTHRQTEFWPAYVAQPAELNC